MGQKNELMIERNKMTITIDIERNMPTKQAK